ISARFGGYKPGLLAISLSIVAFDYYALSSPHTLIPHLNELPRLALFIIAALVIARFSVGRKDTAESLRRAGDELAVTARELKRGNEALQAANFERKEAEKQWRVLIDAIPHQTW